MTAKAGKSSKLPVSTASLIMKVKERPCLWDKTIIEYRDKAARDKAWLEIYRDIEPSFDDLKPDEQNQVGSQLTKKWFNVRDAYLKSAKDSNKRSRPYIYKDLISFLDPILFKHRSLSQEDEKSEEEENWTNESIFIDIDENSNEPPLKQPKIENSNEKEEYNNENVEEDTIIHVLSRLIQKEEDVDRAFFKSITPDVKALSDNAKLEFRIQVLMLLKNLKNREGNIEVNIKTNFHSDSE